MRLTSAGCSDGQRFVFLSSFPKGTYARYESLAADAAAMLVSLHSASTPQAQRDDAWRALGQRSSLPRLEFSADAYARLAKEHTDALALAADIPASARTPAQQRAVDDAQAAHAAIVKKTKIERDARDAAIAAAAQAREKAAAQRAARDTPVSV